ncbi:MAG: dihydrofolate reductase [Bdellovibrionaceae bacterium]|nr:dihydrofolate reductase [Pseudobdellovibrionaceae bacterium]
MILSHIVAASENGTIGVEGTLPWDIPEDMKFFREKTKGKAIIMGRKTFESVGHPLPKRLNVVITRQADYKAEGAVIVSTIEEAIEVCKKETSTYGDEVFIIGGGEIYRQSMDLVNKIYLTRIHKEYSGDAKYPTVDENVFRLIESSDRTQPIPFTFLTYERI